MDIHRFEKIVLDKHNLWVQKIKDRNNPFCIPVRNTKLDNGKHVALFDMSTLYD